MNIPGRTRTRRRGRARDCRPQDRSQSPLKQEPRCRRSSAAGCTRHHPSLCRTRRHCPYRFRGRCNRNPRCMRRRIGHQNVHTRLCGRWDVACRATARLRCRHAVGLVAAVGSARRPFTGTVHVLEALRQSSSSACCARNYWIGNCIAAVACELAALAVRERATGALLRAWDARLAALDEAGDDSAVDHITVPRTRIQATVLRGDNAGAAVWCAHSGLCQSAGIAGWLMALKGVAGIALIEARSTVDKSATRATISKRTKFWRNRARAVIRLAHYRSCQSPCAACGLHP